MRFGNVLIVALLLGLTSAALGQRQKLSVGDRAPGLDIDTWVKGEPVSIEKGKVYVVEFWATWCVPCRKSIPHLTQLQEQYRVDGLTILGISDEPSEKVSTFVRKQGDRMDYAVATDRRNSTRRAWFDAAGMKGIPTAFIVDRKSQLAYIGNPLDEQFPVVLSQVIKGRYDPKLLEQAAPMLTAARQARKWKNWRLASRHFDEVIRLDGRVFAEVALERFEMMIVDMKDPAAAYAYAEGELIGGLFRKDADALRQLASKITLNPKIKKEHRDLEVAEGAAARALKISGSADPKSLATMALVNFHQGRIDAAIDLQAEAYFVARPRKKSDYERVLISYQNAVARLPGSP
ncbi:MAG: TlpA family protein disulfide reductase [Planctomycetes bacterium]|nr:TlpA family protein disulfide reductase [Planctomycetota bacterium]